MKKIKISSYIYLLINISLTTCILEIPVHSVTSKNLRKLTIKEESFTLDKKGLLVAKVKIGSANQEFNLILDTTSNITWVPLNGSKDDYTINNHYDPERSSTSKSDGNQYEINIDGYSCKGSYYQDEIQFGADKKFNLHFGAASETKFNVENIDGIIGLSYNEENENLSFINSLKKAGITDTSSFSISVDENPNATTGKIYLGKHEDFSKNGSIPCPLKFDKYKNFWAYNLKDFVIEKNKTEIKVGLENQVIFDTASNLIILPKSYFEKIKEDISTSFGCKYVVYGSYNDPTYKLACTEEEKLPNFKLKLNGQLFILPKEYIFTKLGDAYYSKIVFNGENAVIGTPFFSVFHTMFDQEKKMLRFYPKNEEYIERGELEEEEEKEKKEEKETGFKTIYLAYIIPPAVVLILIIILIIVCIKKRQKRNNFSLELDRKDEESDILPK